MSGEVELLPLDKELQKVEKKTKSPHFQKLRARHDLRNW